MLNLDHLHLEDLGWQAFIGNAQEKEIWGTTLYLCSS